MNEYVKVIVELSAEIRRLQKEVEDFKETKEYLYEKIRILEAQTAVETD